MPRTPQRTCAVTRTAHDRDELVRLVASPDGEVVVDYHHKLPGRGAWILPRADVLALLARRKGAVEKELGARLDPAAVVEALRACVRTGVLDGLSMTEAAGALVVGRDRLLPAITSGGVRWVGIASDASPRVKDELEALAAALAVDEADEDEDEEEDEEEDDEARQDGEDAGAAAVAAVPSLTLVPLPWTAAEIGARLGRGPIAAFGAPSSRPAAWLRAQLRRLSALG